MDPFTIYLFATVIIQLQDLHDCGAPCHAMFFPERERTVLRYWVGSWAAVCVASCLFTVSVYFPIYVIFKEIKVFYIPIYEKQICPSNINLLLYD